MEVCRELEQKYGLKNAVTLANDDNSPYLKKVDYERGDVKKQIASVLRSVHKSYHFQSFGEYNAMLRCFNIEVKAVKGEHKGVPYNGIIYSATDDGGQPVGTPYKASLFGKSFGYEGIEKRIERCAENFRGGKVTPKIRKPIAEAMRSCTTMKQFVARLSLSNIDVIFRQNDTGRIYGVTFIDHNERAAFNGSRLGRDFSANIFNDLFNDTSPRSRLSNTPDASPVQITPLRDSHSSDFGREVNIRNDKITWDRISAALLGGLVLFSMNWWMLRLPLSNVFNAGIYILTLTTGYIMLLMAGVWISRLLDGLGRPM